MYEIMDQPLPEHLADVPSAKALGFLFFDLKARCEFKWKDWDPVIKWVIEMIKFARFLVNNGCNVLTYRVMSVNLCFGKT